MKENYNLYIDISLSDVEKEVCKKNSTKHLSFKSSLTSNKVEEL